MLLFTPFYPGLIEQQNQKQLPQPLGRRITREDASRSIDSIIEAEDIKQSVECRLLMNMFPKSKISNDFFVRNNEICDNSENPMTNDDFYKLLLEDKNGKKLANWIYLIVCIAYFQVYGTFQYEETVSPLPWVIDFINTLPPEENENKNKDNHQANPNLICASIILNSGIVEQLSTVYTIQLTEEDSIYTKTRLNSIPNKMLRDEKNNIDLRSFLKKYQTHQTKIKAGSYLVQCYYLHYLRIVKSNKSVYCGLLITFGSLVFVSAISSSLGLPAAAFGISVGTATLVGTILFAPRSVEKTINAITSRVPRFWQTAICNVI